MQGLSAARTTRTAAVRWPRHGTYGRKTPPGARVPRWYCRESHTTISLLADCLAARLPGTLDDLEAVVVAAEGARSVASANELHRPEDDDAVELAGAMRWVRRRVRLVHDVLVRVIGLIPDRLAGCAATHGGGARSAQDRPRVDGAAQSGLPATADAAGPAGLPTAWNRGGRPRSRLPTLDGA